MPFVELTTNTDENKSANLPETMIPVPATFVTPSIKARIGIIYPPPEIRSKFFSLIS
jgi:hypothetical protein